MIPKVASRCLRQRQRWPPASIRRPRPSSLPSRNSSARTGARSRSLNIRTWRAGPAASASTRPGKAIILAETPFQRRELFNRYVRGAPEPIRSSFSDHDVRTWVIRLLSQVKAVKQSDVPRLLSNTYGGFLARKPIRIGRSKTESPHRGIVTQFLELGLLERHDDQVQLTLLGRACGQSSLAFDSSMRLIEAIRSTSGRETHSFQAGRVDPNAPRS